MTTEDQDHANKTLEQAHRERIRIRNEYWNSLRRAREEYLETNDNIENIAAFEYWIEHNYGIQLVFSPENPDTITEHFWIVDEAKYLMYCLKFRS